MPPRPCIGLAWRCRRRGARAPLDGIRTALSIDGGNETVRQTLVALLMEQRRYDEALRLLRQGLDINPGNTAFAMQSARILVERGDLDAALGVLQQHAPAAGGNAEYHAFVGALYQRVGRHKEAVDEYQAALRLSPHSGIWWVGLGISQEAAARREDALISFRRAQAAGNLSPELVAYVDQRLRQLK